MASDSEGDNATHDLESLHVSRYSSLPSDSLDSEPENEQGRIVPGKPFPNPVMQQSLKSKGDDR